METKKVKIEGREYPLLRYGNEWVFPLVETYQYGLGCPIALTLYCLENNGFDIYTVVTVNLPDCPRRAGCQFIDTNKNDSGILDWLEENQFGVRTGNCGESGFCKYPEFDFYKGEKFREYKKISEQFEL